MSSDNNTNAPGHANDSYVEKKDVRAAPTTTADPENQSATPSKKGRPIYWSITFFIGEIISLAFTILLHGFAGTLISDPFTNSVVGDLGALFEEFMFHLWLKSVLAIMVTVAYWYFVILAYRKRTRGENWRYLGAAHIIFRTLNFIFIGFILFNLAVDISMAITIYNRPSNDGITTMVQTNYSGSGTAQSDLRNLTQQENSCCFYRNLTSSIPDDFSISSPLLKSPTQQDCPTNWQSSCTNGACSGSNCNTNTHMPCNCMDVVILNSREDIANAWTMARIASVTCALSYLLIAILELTFGARLPNL